MTDRLSLSGFLGLGLAWVALGGRPIAGDAQQPLRDNRDAGKVEVQKVVTLRFQNAAVAPDFQTQVFRMPDGGWGAISRVFRGLVPLFSATGSPTGTLGRAGPGPGEFKNPAFAMAVGKQLWVVDPGNNQLSAFGSDGTLIRDRTLPGPVFWVQPTADDGGLLLSGYFGSRTVARVGMDKADDRFGGDVGGSNNAYVQQHVAAETSAGEVWAVARAGGGIDILRADDLESLASTRLPEDLSQPVRHPRTDYRKERPGPGVYGVMAGPGGIVWIVMSVADAHWKPRPGVNPREYTDRIFDTLIVAVSTQDRAVVGARRMDRFCMPALSVVGDNIACVNEGAATIDIWRFNLER